MPEERVLALSELPPGTRKVVKLGETEILLINYSHTLMAVQAKCPHAGAPLEEGAICDNKLICPWHLGTFALPSGELLEPPPMAPLKTYAVQVRGDDIFVNPQPVASAVTSKPSPPQAILLIGAGAAGAMAAAIFCQSGFQGKLLVVDPMREEPVDRTQLSKDGLAGKMPLEKTALNVFEGMNVQRFTSPLAEFSAARHQARLNDGTVLRFDHALVATGGTPKRLQIPGAELAHTIRHSEDVRQILASTDEQSRIVIVGTSFIGLEAASALVQRGNNVTVVGHEEQPFAKQLGTLAASALKSLHDQNGTKFRLGVEIVKITQNDVFIKSIANDDKVPADLVILGVGVTPELGFQHDLPLSDDGGIRTNNTLQPAPGVWVAGDIASVDGLRIEHWRVAQQHGRIAALAMLGGDQVYSGVPYFWTYHFGHRLGYLGHATHWDETFLHGSLDEWKFLLFYLNAGRVEAVLGCGLETEQAALSEPMRHKPTLAEALRVINV